MRGNVVFDGSDTNLDGNDTGGIMDDTLRAKLEILEWESI
jgi:hypothetical protein